MDAAVLQLALGVWIACFHVMPQGVLTWWVQLQRFANPVLVGAILGLLGALRIVWAVTGRSAPRVALLSAVLYFVFAFDIWYTLWRSIGLPFFLWHGYQSIKSYLRLALMRGR